MRCLNCHTGLQAMDKRCPACGMATPVARAAAISLWARAAFDRSARRKYILTRRLYGLLALVAGALVALAGGEQFFDARSGDLKSRRVTAAELLAVNRPEDLPGWISYASERTVETCVEYVKMTSRQRMSRFVLLQVADQWLLAKVDARFNNVVVEGQLKPFDTLALSKIQNGLPNEGQHMLPYMLDAEYDIAATQRQQAGYGGVIAVIGVLLFLGGVGGLVVQPPPYVGPLKEGPMDETPAEALSEPEATAERPRRGRCWAVRALFVVVWAVAFFLVGAVVASQVATAGAEDDPVVRQPLAEESGKKAGPWIFLGSVGGAVVLGWRGWLPGTRR